MVGHNAKISLSLPRWGFWLEIRFVDTESRFTSRHVWIKLSGREWAWSTISFACICGQPCLISVPKLKIFIGSPFRWSDFDFTFVDTDSGFTTRNVFTKIIGKGMGVVDTIFAWTSTCVPPCLVSVSKSICFKLDALLWPNYRSHFECEYEYESLSWMCVQENAHWKKRLSCFR